MKAIQIAKTGGPEVLEYVDLPKPAPAAGQVLIKVVASGVNFIDTYLREGRYPAPLPFIAGQEGAGVVEGVGEGATGFQEGDHVAWMGTRGSYAEYAAVPAADVLHVPEKLSLHQAAAAMIQGVTAHYLSHSTYPIQKGDTVLVHAGAGGVGLLLTQMAKMLGATVLTTVSTEDKAALSREAGADQVILYTQQDFREELLKFTGGVGIPVVYDAVGKTTFEDSLKCLRTRGMMVLYGASSGAVPPLDPIRLMSSGSLYLTRPTSKDYTRTRAELEQRMGDVFGWILDGKLKVRIGHEYPLAEAAQAQKDLEGRKTTGKVLLIP